MTSRRDRLGELLTSRPVAVSMVFLAAFVFGWFSYQRLPVNLMPELDYPTLTIRTNYPGAAPAEVENDVSRPIEEALGVVGGLARISSVSRAGLSDVVLEFGWDTEVSEATQEVLEKLDLVFLPREAQRPLILHYDPSLEPILELSLSGRGARFEGEGGQRRLRRLAEQQVKRTLEPIKGVAAVRVRGGLEEEIHVLMSEQQLRRTGLSIQQVIDRLQQENVNLAGGMIEEGRTEYMVRTVGEFEDVSQIAETSIDIVDGREVRVRDLGRVEMRHADREVFTRTDGGESVQIEIFKEADANIVALAALVREQIGPEPGASGDAAGRGVAARLWNEEGATLRVVADRSRFIEASIDEVRTTAVLGMLLATVLLYLFLRSTWTTLVIFLSIPISLVVTFAPMNLLGVSLNIMSLGGLAMGVGMLVDNSIVVLESIHRCREEGDGLVAAAIRGTGEVRSAVIASTLTTIAVFFPIVFVQGVAGQAFGDLGLAVVISLLASLAVALFLIPMLASRRALEPAAPGREPETTGASAGGARPLRALERFRRETSDPATGAWYTALVALPTLLVGGLLELLGRGISLLLSVAAGLAAFVVGRIGGTALRALAWLPATATSLVMQAAARVYPRILRAALAHPVVVLLLVAGCAWGTWELQRTATSELLPEVHQGEFTVEVELPIGTPVEKTDAVLAPIERAILEHEEHIRSLILTVGRDPSRSRTSDEGEHTARFKVLLDTDAGRRVEERVVTDLRERFAGIPDLQARVSRPVLFSFKTPVEVEIRGDDLRDLRTIGLQAATAMSRIPELADVELSLKQGAPEVQIDYDRNRLSAYDLGIGSTARLVRAKVRGSEATRFNMGDRKVPVIVRLRPEDRATIDAVRSVSVNPGSSRVIPLAAVADVALAEGPSEIRRIDGRRVALVTANLAGGSLSAAVEAIRERLDSEIAWPAELSYSITGQNEEWERSRASLWLALGLSVFLVFVIMAAQFESLVHPLVIMFSIPLAFVGTFALIRLFGMSLSIVVFLGMIMLAGIVVNNAIILVDYINRLRGRGLELDEAIVKAGSIRLRPILMTTLTTVLGLLPMAAGLGEGAELRTPMAMAVIGGLISSTALTLIVVPTAYRFVDLAVGAVARRVQAAIGAGAGQSGAIAP